MLKVEKIDKLIIGYAREQLQKTLRHIPLSEFIASYNNYVMYIQEIKKLSKLKISDDLIFEIISRCNKSEDIGCYLCRDPNDYSNIYAILFYLKRL